MRQYLTLLCVLLVAFGLAGCKDKEQAGGQMIPYVKVKDIKASNVPWPAEYQATAAGSRAVEVRARVQGIVEKRLYKEGSFIKAGQVMFEIEPDHYQAAYDEAKAAFMNADRECTALSNYESTKAALRQAEINLEYCKVVAPVSGYTSKEAVTAGNLVANNTLLTTVNQTDPAPAA